MTDQTEELPHPDLDAVIHIPKIYRKQPAEAYASEAYFFMYWWYRASSWLMIGGASLTCAGFAGVIVWHEAFPAGVLTCGMLVTTIGAMLAVATPLMKPLQGVREPDDEDML